MSKVSLVEKVLALLGKGNPYTKKVLLTAASRVPAFRVRPAPFVSWISEAIPLLRTANHYIVLGMGSKASRAVARAAFNDAFLGMVSAFLWTGKKSIPTLARAYRIMAWPFSGQYRAALRASGGNPVEANKLLYQSKQLATIMRGVWLRVVLMGLIIDMAKSELLKTPSFTRALVDALIWGIPHAIRAAAGLSPNTDLPIPPHGDFKGMTDDEIVKELQALQDIAKDPEMASLVDDAMQTLKAIGDDSGRQMMEWDSGRDDMIKMYQHYESVVKSECPGLNPAEIEAETWARVTAHNTATALLTEMMDDPALIEAENLKALRAAQQSQLPKYLSEDEYKALYYRYLKEYETRRTAAPLVAWYGVFSDPEEQLQLVDTPPLDYPDWRASIGRPIKVH